jgi:hypothetical protein
MEVFYLQRVIRQNNNSLIYNVLSIVNKRVVSTWGIGEPPKGDKTYFYQLESPEKAQKFIQVKSSNQKHKIVFLNKNSNIYEKEHFNRSSNFSSLWRTWLFKVHK